ncbi:MAG: hypothetical protein GC151_13825 [Betaproteobacteria bacterium]|nr:hypothetical protein [Betaproteobacteria bacterium]
MQALWCLVETTDTTNSSSITTTASSDYANPFVVFGANVPFAYIIRLASTGIPIEAGIGYMSGSTTFVRNTVRATLSAGTLTQSGSPARATLPSGTKYIECAALPQMVQPIVPYVGSMGGKKGVPFGGHPRKPALGGFHFGGAGQIIAWPVINVYGGEVDAFEFYVSTAGAAGALFSIGLWSIGTDGKPDRLVVGAESIDVTTTGYKVGTFTSTVIPPGYYYCGVTSNDATVFLLGSYDNIYQYDWWPGPTGWSTDGFNVGTYYTLGTLTLATTFSAASSWSTNVTTATIVPRAV